MILYVQEGNKLKCILQNFEDYHAAVINSLGDNVKKMYFFKN